jgi:hypothetical protein
MSSVVTGLLCHTRHVDFHSAYAHGFARIAACTVPVSVADPATLRLSIGGKTIDLARSGDGEGAGRLGFAEAIDYRGGDLSVRLAMEIVQQDGLTAGARVPSGSMQIERPGQDAIAVPVAGLIGCRS